MVDYYKYSYVSKYYPNTCYTKDEVVEERDPYLIEDDGQMVGFYFFDKEVWNGPDWLVATGNSSSNVWFGKVYTYEELLNIYKRLSLKDRLIELKRSYMALPTYHEILKYMKEKGLSEICIDRFHDFHVLGKGDITYDELIEKKGKELQKLREEIMKSIPTIQVRK